MDGLSRRPNVDRLARSLWRYRIELLWGAFALANFAAMIAWPSWRLVPFQLVWLSLTIVYGFRVWPLGLTIAVLVCVMAATALAVGFSSMHDIKTWAKLYPLMAALFVAMVWHARRRAEAQQVAEQRADELHSLLEGQKRFVNDVSHELRTPLTIARGHLELLGGDRPETEVALDELARIDGIIDRLLMLAAIDQPDFIHRGPLALEPMLEDLFMRWAEVAPRAWRLGPLATGRLEADADRLRTALDALLENAVKYTEPGAAIELRARPKRGGVLIEVEDEGRGIPPDAQRRIFDRFARADSARTRTAGGVGLGLAIVDAIAKAHGGSCTVASGETGTTFALWLPDFTPESSVEAPPTLTWRPHPAH